MSITVMLRELLDAQPALQRLGAEKLPAKLAYNVARLMRVVQPELDEFYKQRNVLVKEYGVTRPATEEEKPTHGDEVVEVPKEKLEEFRREIDDLANEKITLDRDPLRVTDAFPSMTPADLISLGPLVADEDEVSERSSPSPLVPVTPRVPVTG